MLETRPELKYALYGGVITGITIGVPVIDFLNCFCCAGVMLGGFLTVFFHTRERGRPAVPVTKADAIQMGVLSGLFGAFIGTLLYAVLLLIAGDVMLEMIVSILEERTIREMLPPEFDDVLSELILSKDGFTVVDILMHLLIWLFIAPLFGLIGGLLGFSLLRPDRQPPSAPAFPSSTGQI